MIRSRAGPLLDGSGGKSGECESSNARIAISASVDSETCRRAATVANRCFSSGVGRVVIVGAIDFEAPTFIARKSELQQNADTSLSCHHSKNDPTMLLDPKSLLYPIHKCGPKTLHEFPSIGGLSFGLFSAEHVRRQRNALNALTARPEPSLIAPNSPAAKQSFVGYGKLIMKFNAE